MGFGYKVTLEGFTDQILFRNHIGTGTVGNILEFREIENSRLL